jgi:hypothetical protein
MALNASGLDKATVLQRPRLLSDNGSSYISETWRNRRAPRRCNDRRIAHGIAVSGLISGPPCQIPGSVFIIPRQVTGRLVFLVGQRGARLTERQPAARFSGLPLIPSRLPTRASTSALGYDVTRRLVASSALPQHRHYDANRGHCADQQREQACPEDDQLELCFDGR